MGVSFVHDGDNRPVRDHAERQAGQTYPPRFPSHYHPSSAAPKRDHDEWLVQWGSGGSAVVLTQAKACRGYTVTARDSRWQRAHRLECASRWGSEAATHGQRPWTVLNLGYLSHGPSDPVAMRHGTWSPGPAGHKPKTPVDRRGVSLTYTADYRSGQMPRRSRFAL